MTDAFGAHTSLASDLGHAQNGMRLVLTARGPTTAPALVARDPFQGIGNWRVGPRRVWAATFTIPWQGAPLDEAFVEVDLGALVPIPSSLYGYTHGTADPYATHRVVSAEGVLGPGLF